MLDRAARAGVMTTPPALLPSCSLTSSPLTPTPPYPTPPAARALEDERRKSAKARAAFLEELDQLLNAGDSGNRSLWPRTVRRLVERVEEAAEAEAQGRVAEAQDAVEAQMSRRVEEAEGRARAAEGRAAERAREVEALRARLGVIERELAAREEAMVQRMEEMRGALEAR